MPNYQLWKIGETSTPTAIRASNRLAAKYYPNPCNDYISIELQEPASNIKIITACGNVFEADWTNENNTVRIKTKDLSSGMYKILIEGYNSLNIIKE